MDRYKFIPLQCKIPEPLCAFAGVYISHNYSVFIHGGFGDSESKSIYCLNLESLDWRLQLTHTESLIGHAAVEVEGRMVIFGGWNEKEYTDVILLYDPLENSIKKISSSANPTDWDSPAGRRDHSLTVAKNEIYMFGGWDSWTWNNAGGTFAKLWKLTHDFTWELCEVFGENPSTRRGHSTVYNEKAEELLVFGGIYGYTALLSDMYVLRLCDMQWNKVSFENGPGKRAWHSAASIGEVMYVFGGLVEMKKASNELFRFDMGLKEWQEISVESSPAPRYGGLMVNVNGFLLILGGKGSKEEVFQDSHVLDIEGNFLRFKEYSEEFGVSQIGTQDISIPPIPKELQVSRRHAKKSDFIFSSFK